MHYNGAIYLEPKKKKEKVETIIPFWKKVLYKVDIPAYIAAGIWVIWLYLP